MTTKDDRQDGPIESRMHLYIMHTRGEEKKGKVFDGGNRGSKNIRAHVEISRDLFRDRDWIRSPEGWWYRGENLLSSPPLPSLLDLRRFMGNSRPPVSPTVRKQSAYDASIVELSMEIPSKLLSNFVHATLPPPPPPPSHPFMHTRRYGGGGTGFDAVSSIICSRRVNSSRCEGA